MTFPVKMLTDRKESSHFESPNYDAEITSKGEALATFEDRVFPWKTKIGLMKQKNLDYRSAGGCARVFTSVY
jgi:hypothetical protein